MRHEHWSTIAAVPANYTNCQSTTAELTNFAPQYRQVVAPTSAENLGWVFGPTLLTWAVRQVGSYRRDA
jgi:hypothetical protein